MLSSKGNFIGCENQTPFDYTTRVKAFMEQIGQDPATGPYAYYCGASHAELWRIQYSYDEVQRPDGQTVWVPRAPVATVNAAVSVCVDAGRAPAPHLGHLHGNRLMHQMQQRVPEKGAGAIAPSLFVRWGQQSWGSRLLAEARAILLPLVV